MVFQNYKKFAEALSEIAGRRIAPSTIHGWVGIGWVPPRRAEAVHRLTGVPIADLIRKPKTEGSKTNGR